MVRPIHNFYQSLNYNIVKRSGRNWVLCNICKKLLHNTAVSRLKSHRFICPEILPQENYNCDSAAKHDSSNPNQLSDDDDYDTGIQNVERLFNCESNENPDLRALNTTESNYNCIDETFQSEDPASSLVGVSHTSASPSSTSEYEFRSDSSSPDTNTTIHSVNKPIFVSQRTTFKPENQKYQKAKIVSGPYDFGEYKDEDLERNKKVLELIDVYKQSNEYLLKSCKIAKYKRRISQIFQADKNIHEGSLKTLKNDTNLEYVYWNNPNSLVNRLRFLFSTENIDHMEHHNEIIYIIEELKKFNIIE